MTRVDVQLAPSASSVSEPAAGDTPVREPVRRAMAVCQVEVAIAVVGGAWKMTIAKHLAEATMRFGQLRRAVGEVSERTLARQLRELEADGVVHRRVYAEVPPRVEYSLTDLGRTLVPLVGALDEWGAAYLHQVSAAESGNGAGSGRAG
ncbi:MAG TPA: helix-turn-helix domain-containing protein [Beutenbergiaceae bacterium]|nr:helix-turn-helix domain-containing protein [Beutenbergiaceae bacterium]